MEGVEEREDGEHRSELSTTDLEWQAAQFHDSKDDSTRNKHEGNTHDTLKLFDEWMAYYCGESRPYGQLQKAAEGTLTAKKPPPKTK